MRTYFYLNNKKVTRSFLESLAGRDSKEVGRRC